MSHEQDQATSQRPRDPRGKRASSTPTSVKRVGPAQWIPQHEGPQDPRPEPGARANDAGSTEHVATPSSSGRPAGCGQPTDRLARVRAGRVTRAGAPSLQEEDDGVTSEREATTAGAGARRVAVVGSGLARVTARALNEAACLTVSLSSSCIASWPLSSSAFKAAAAAAVEAVLLDGGSANTPYFVQTFASKTGF